MKKTMIFAAAAAMMMMQAPVTASACSDDDVRVMVKTEIDLGNQRVYSGMVGVGDLNDDHRITTDEVLFITHELDYPGGAAAGLGANCVWGRSGSFITEVRDENGKLRVDNPKEYEAGTQAPLYSQTVENGDTVHCYAIALDQPCYELTVDAPDLSIGANSKIPTGTVITATAVLRDPNKAEPQPLSGVELLQDGKRTGIKTDKNGKAAMTFAQAGDFDIAGDFSAYGISEVSGSYSIHVMDAQKMRQVDLTVRKNDGEPEVASKLWVYDYNGDGRITAKDAFSCTTAVYYPIGNYPDKIFGSDGSFICTVSDANGTPKFIAPVRNQELNAELENGYAVDFALEGLKRTEKRAVPAEAAQTTAPAVTTAAAETTATEAVTAAAQTTEASVTTAAAETAVQTTAAPAQTTAANTVKTNANGSVKTGSLQTGDSAPLLACEVCILSGLVALVFCRKRCR